MNGSNMTSMAFEQARSASLAGRTQSDFAAAKASAPYVWDGLDEDERPLSADGMRAGMAANLKRRGRPVGSAKDSTTLRIDRDVLNAFKASGAGWQTKMNAALKDWLRTHAVT